MFLLCAALGISLPVRAPAQVVLHIRIEAGRVPRYGVFSRRDKPLEALRRTLRTVAGADASFDPDKKLSYNTCDRQTRARLRAVGLDALQARHERFAEDVAARVREAVQARPACLPVRQVLQGRPAQARATHAAGPHARAAGAEERGQAAEGRRCAPVPADAQVPREVAAACSMRLVCAAHQQTSQAAFPLLCRNYHHVEEVVINALRECNAGASIAGRAGEAARQLVLTEHLLRGAARP